LRLERFNRSGHWISLVADDGDHSFRLQRYTAAHHVFKEWAPTSAMQHFRERRFQPRALASSQNDDDYVFVRHSAAILSRPGGFDNPARHFSKGFMPQRPRRPKLRDGRIDRFPYTFSAPFGFIG
jgi:hypothetical protein